MREMKNGEEAASPSSSPPTPPSPLPVSVGPGNQRYLFSSSPSPPSSSSNHTSTEELPLLKEYNASIWVTSARSPFSLDRPWEPEPAESSSGRSCLKDLLEWFVQRCCSCCSWTLTSHFKPHEN